MRVCAVAVPQLLLVGVVLANLNVPVVRRQLSFEETHVLVVDASVEYILEFTPVDDQGQWPSRIWMKLEGGDIAHPLLVTARQRIGSTTWQLPFSVGDSMLFQLERTLCPEDAAGIEVEDLDQDCVGSEPSVRGWMSLHVGTSCAAPAALSLRVVPDRDWLLPFDTPLFVHTAMGSPRVHWYRFEEEQWSVRLVVESQDYVCATIAIQNYTCPIADTKELIRTDTVRMTVLRSGGTQLSRWMYPLGFYVTALVHEDDSECREAEDEPDEWLWEAALLPGALHPARPAAPPARLKALTLHVRPSLTRMQYVVGIVVALAVFLLFYVLFGVMVLAQRIPAWKKLVGPRAVLAPKPEEPIRSEVDVALPAAGVRRRRGSDATFDSSDNSDTDEEDNVQERGTDTTVDSIASSPGATAADATTATTASGETDVTGNGIFVINENSSQARQVREAAQSPPGGGGVQRAPSAARPFGLPARLRVAALARRRERVLHARSDRYLYTLYTVGLFYALPVIQFVAAFQIVMNLWGSLDICYYNFLCAHPAGSLSDFNHVYSNVGYLLLGALFMLQVRRRKMRRKRKPRNEEYGIPAHYGLLSSLGAAMMMVALLSAAYHICPNRLNFQFDTAFMYVIAVLSTRKTHQTHHPDINARAHATFAVLAVLLFLVVWGVLGGGPLFWSLFAVIHIFSFLIISLRIYYVGQFRLEKESLQVAARELRSLPRVGLRPLYISRMVMLLIANAVNWGFALYGLFTQGGDFASHLLFVLLANTLLYMVFYLAMKLLHGERLRWYAWTFLAGGALAWAPALFFFVSGSSAWSLSPALSRHRNHECMLLHFYDSHDLWHMLSAVALYFSFNAMLTWDDGLAAIKRTEIAVF
uniref:Systemic interferece defective-1 protein n=1 Tax=Hyphantria cunea TaxID=39466 RepID=A0A385JPJ4_HYPCU|nr:systemic interferece defective-1 protein [Hyphantria cunea]